MENININYITQRIKHNKRKLYEKIYDIETDNLTPEKKRKMIKSSEEKFIQLLDDSDSLEEISPELYNKIEEEQEKKIPLSNNIKVIGQSGYIRRRNSLSKFKNLSNINIGISNYKKYFFKDKENNRSSDNTITEKKTFTNKKNIFSETNVIIEEDQKEDDDNNSAGEKSKIGSIENKFNKIIIEEGSERSCCSELNLKKTKSKDFIANGSEKKSKLSDEIKNLAKTLSVFLFNSDESIKISIYPSNTVKEIKSKIVHELKRKKYNLTNTSTDAYDLRLIEEEGDSPDMDFPPLRDYVRVAGLKPQALAFLKNEDYIPKYTREKSFDLCWLYQKQQNLMFGSFKERNSRFSVVPEEDDEDGPDKYEIKIYYKDIKEENAIKSEDISLNPEDTLKDILQHFFKKNILKIKNVNLYYFITHNNDEDLDNPFNLDINIKYLPPPYELDLCYKFFPDLPHALNTYKLSVNKKSIEERIKNFNKE